ncbi:hypothetical protein [Thermocatellispora tengchongensis]|uniref:hypothetical protein n=1 Tax=Thermocatellispora tengchongensis TaxID=1073253 RepID=UPI0036352289
MAEQPSLFAPDPDAVQSKPPGTQFERMKILITVKAAPNPSATYGETVCVAGLRLDLDRPGWVRLYPINYRELDGDSRFRKYDVVNLYAKPSANDPRVESWRPRIDSFVVEKHLDGWSKRMPYIGDYIEESMCGLIADVKERPPARSLAAVRPAEILALDIEPHPGWTRAEQDKIDQYVRQLDLYDTAPRTALEAPGSRRGTAIGAVLAAATPTVRASSTGSSSPCSAASAIGETPRRWRPSERSSGI